MRHSELGRFAFVLLIPGVLAAQGGPRIGFIEIYGARKVPEVRILKALGVHVGDPLPRSKYEAEDRIDSVPGIVTTRLEAACCEQGKAVLYVGVEEKNSLHLNFRTPPEAEVGLPETLSEAYRKFLSALNEAVRKGETAEDLTAGHSLMKNPECHGLQEQFVTLAAENLENLRVVLRTSLDEQQRAIAAYVIGYAPKQARIIGPVVEDLQYALQDPDETVRSNAMRALGALTVLSKLDPTAEIKISPTWFIELLNSIVWTDRNNAAIALVNLTESRDVKVLEQLKGRALPALIEMAKWRQLAHALPAFILLGRVASMPEKQIQEAWTSGDREALIQKALKKS